MARYIMTFFKYVLSSNGHHFKAPQEKIEVRADTSEQAIEAAKRHFASMRQIPDWRYHADTVEVAMGSARNVDVVGYSSLTCRGKKRTRSPRRPYRPS